MIGEGEYGGKERIGLGIDFNLFVNDARRYW